jgi:hypothetical protein
MYKQKSMCRCPHRAGAEREGSDVAQLEHARDLQTDSLGVNAAATAACFYFPDTLQDRCTIDL